MLTSSSQIPKRQLREILLKTPSQRFNETCNNFLCARMSAIKSERQTHKECVRIQIKQQFSFRNINLISPSLAFFSLSLFLFFSLALFLFHFNSHKCLSCAHHFDLRAKNRARIPSKHLLRIFSLSLALVLRVLASLFIHS